MYQNIFLISKKQQEQQQKKTRIQKAKETKEEKRIFVENLTGDDNNVCEINVFF